MRNTETTLVPDVISATHTHRLNDRLARVVNIHFDPHQGTAFWLDRQRTLGIDARKDILSIEDLPILGSMSQSDLSGRELIDFIPRRFHDQLHRFVIAQTGGTTGDGVWTAYRDDEFKEAFVDPFVVVAKHLNFPHGEHWLFVGPSGPHIIGKVVRFLSNALESPDPFCIDLDPRWIRHFDAGSFAHKRYLNHLIDQAMCVINTQTIGVLFTTPSIIESLADHMSAEQRSRIVGIHYGGMAMPPDLLDQLSEEFPNATHLAGYGNTLFGCCLELQTTTCRQHLDYYPMGDRLIFELVDDSGEPCTPGQIGRVRFTRLDESFLIVRFLERDMAHCVALTADPPTGFSAAGMRNPHTPEVTRSRQAGGLY